MLPRAWRSELRAKLRTFPVVMLVGPRQCGKTTFIREELRGWRHLDLERPGDLQALAFDVQGFLERHEERVAVDEAQRFPDLFPALRHAVDRNRRPGRYVLTGSADPRLLKTAGEALTGRVGIIEMTPFLLSELGSKAAWLNDRWFWGGFPPLYHLRTSARRADWLGNYLSLVLERDIPSLGLRLPPLALMRLCQMLAHVHGGLLSLSDLGKSLSLSHHTVSHYLDVLEGAFVIRRLRPYFANLGKRLTKSPKLYVRDTGLLHHLAGLAQPSQLEVWPRRGASWEGLIVEELIARARLEHPSARAYFWRTQAGAEVDLLLEIRGRKLAFEIKLGAAPSTQSMQALRQCLKDLAIPRGFVIYGGGERLAIGAGIVLVPWRDVLKPGALSRALR